MMIDPNLDPYSVESQPDPLPFDQNHQSLNLIFYPIDLDGDGETDTISLTAQSDLNNTDVSLDSQDALLEDICPIIGEPSDIQNWHQQGYSNTCAIASQEFILDELTGQDVSEEQLMQIAYDNGWYNPDSNGGGTPLAHMGNLLEAFGIPVERHSQGATFDTLTEKLAQGEKVIVALDADEIWTPGQDGWQDDVLQDQPGMPGQDANHAVQVVGIDYSDPNNPKVILNDPGCPDGQGKMVSQSEFMGAWEDSGNFMVSTALHSASTTAIASNPLGQEQMLGGYYNADGTYHYTSDNTDRDPETGAIIRRW